MKIEIMQITLDLFLVFIHMSLRFGSVGHGLRDASFINIPAIIKNNNAKTEIQTLNLEMIISSGKILIIDARVTPAPKETNKAGSAQHIKVVDEAKRVRNPMLFDSFI